MVHKYVRGSRGGEDFLLVEPLFGSSAGLPGESLEVASGQESGEPGGVLPAPLPPGRSQLFLDVGQGMVGLPSMNDDYEPEEKLEDHLKSFAAVFIDISRLRPNRQCNQH